MTHKRIATKVFSTVAEYKHFKTCVSQNKKEKLNIRNFICYSFQVILLWCDTRTNLPSLTSPVTASKSKQTGNKIDALADGMTRHRDTSNPLIGRIRFFKIGSPPLRSPFKGLLKNQKSQAVIGGQTTSR